MLPILIFVIVSTIAFIGCVLQIMWLRKKLADYSESQMAAKLATQAIELAVHSSNTQVYSLIVNAQLTRKLSHASDPDYLDLQKMYAPMSFSLPQTCNGNFSTALISCNKIAFLALEMNQGAASLTEDLMRGNIFYLMVKEVLYLASFIPDNRKNPIICLYTIKSSKNVPTASECNVGLVPFFGKTSTDSTDSLVKLLNIDSGMTTFPLHALGILVNKA